MFQTKNNISRILLVRLSALGDCVAAIPVFLALRKNYPHSHIAWVVQDNMAPLLQNLPGLDELIVFPRKRLQRITSNWGWINEVLRFVYRLRKRRFDMAIDVQSNTKSAVISYCSRARVRIGHGKGEAKEISAWLNNKLVDADDSVKHVFFRNLRLLQALEIKIQHPEFHIPKNPWLHKKMAIWLQKKNIQSMFVLIIPFTGKKIKEWLPEKYIEFAGILADYSVPVIFLSSPGRREETKSMMPATNNQHTQLSPELTIPEMIELIRLSHIVVGGDTGPVHIAGALEKNTFALFGPTDPDRHKPWGPTSIYTLDTEPIELANAIMKVMN